MSVPVCRNDGFHCRNLSDSERSSRADVGNSLNSAGERKHAMRGACRGKVMGHGTVESRGFHGKVTRHVSVRSRLHFGL